MLSCYPNYCNFILQVELAVEEKCEFIPFQSPKEVILEQNKIVAIEFYRMEQDENDEWVEDTEQITRLKANFIISAFGSGLYDLEGM
jgi:dihydropyrimidine dehydrogenase (NADP+)